jgi:hypothetical protein
MKAHIDSIVREPLGKGRYYLSLNVVIFDLDHNESFDEESILDIKVMS